MSISTEKEVAVSDNEYRITRIPEAEENTEDDLSASATIGLMVVCSTEFGIPMNEGHAELMADISICRVKELAWDEVADKIEDEYTTLRGLADYLRKQNPHRYDKEALEEKVRQLNDAEVSAG